MNQAAIFGPFFAMIALVFVVWVYMYSRRIPFILGGTLTQEQMITPGLFAQLSPLAVNNPSENLKNLFEMPVLFYALVLYLFATSRVDGAYVAAAWIFVAFRALHSAVHCTFNIVNLRFALYLISTLALVYMAFRAAFAHWAA
ncbi:MAG: MAPEG family protein [Myxococcota bacterium]